MIDVESDDSFEELILEGCKAQRIASTSLDSSSRTASSVAKSPPIPNKPPLDISQLSFSSEDELPLFSGSPQTDKSDDSSLELHSLDLSSTNDSPHKDRSTNDSPHKDNSTNDSPHKDSSTNDSPHKDSSTNDSPHKHSSTNDSPHKDSSTNDSPHKHSSTNDSPHKDTGVDDSSDDEAYERFLEKMKGANHRATVPSDSESGSDLDDSLGDFIVPDDESLSEGSDNSVFYLKTTNLLRNMKPIEVPTDTDGLDLSFLNLSDSPADAKPKAQIAKQLDKELSSPQPCSSQAVDLVDLSDSDESFDELIKEGLHIRKLSQTPAADSKKGRRLPLQTPKPAKERQPLFQTPKHRPFHDSINLDLSLSPLSEEDVLVIAEPVETPAPKFTKPPPGGTSFRTASHSGMFTPAPYRTKKEHQLHANLLQTEPRLRRPQATFLSSLSINFDENKTRHPDVERYLKEFNKHRNELVEKLSLLYNQTVFDNKLSEVPVSFNNRLLKTAGLCKYTVTRTNKIKQASVELSEKVCDSAERVRDTLIHELCHAAVWIVNGVEDGHGRFWQYWARKAQLAHRDLPPIRRCHSYDITTKFVYKCTKCGYQVGRHSKSIDTEKKVCGKCTSKFELLTRSSKGLKAVTQSTPNKFAMFVKENYGSVRKGNSSHKETMQKLSEQFSTRVKV